ncbi:MAG: hypothetical protein ACRBBW_03970 [Cellvibrionaceae bacterium]
MSKSKAEQKNIIPANKAMVDRLKDSIKGLDSGKTVSIGVGFLESLIARIELDHPNS